MTTTEDLLARALALPAEQQRALAWRLIDAIGISVIVALDVDDVIVERAEFDEPAISRDRILAAMQDVAEQDWSLYSDGARHALDVRLDEIEKAEG